jgi:predicted transcriptional regulator
VEHVGEQENAHSVFMRKPEWNNPLAGARPRWKNDIEMDLEKSNGKAWTGPIMFGDRDNWWTV